MQQPRQMYGLGSLVKSITKGVKKVVKSPLGKAAALYFAPALIPGGAKTLGGVFQNMGGLSGIKNALFANPAIYQQKLMGAEKGFFPGLMDKFSNMGSMGKFATTFGIGALGGGALQALEAAGLDTNNPNEMPGDVESLKSYLKQGYLQLNPDKTPQDAEAFAEANTTEYRANGGRIGFADGMPKEGIETLLPKQRPSKMMQEVDSVTQSVDNFAQLIAQSGDPSSFRGHVDLLSEFIQKNDIDPSAAFDYVKRRVDEIKPGLSKFIFTTTEDMPVQKAYGGRIGFDKGTLANGTTDFQKWLEGKQKFDQGQNAEQLYREYLEDKRRQKIAEQKTMAANGGRIGYSGGTKGPDDLYTRSYKRVMELMDEGYDFGSAVKKYMEEEKERENKSYGGRIGYRDAGVASDFQKWLEGKQKFDQGQNAEQLYREYLEDKRRQKVAEQKTMAANGGRIGYAFGNNPEQNAINAAGIMDLPLNQNPAGATELDLRDSGGFIPPVGVKEKADDIPAMLSNNEFVFTADAVRGMGDGDVNKGAQRMYDMMKKLEGGGRV